MRYGSLKSNYSVHPYEPIVAYWYENCLHKNNLWYSYVVIPREI